MSLIQKVCKTFIQQAPLASISRSFSSSIRTFEEEKAEEVIPGIPYEDIVVGVVKELGPETRAPQSPASIEDMVKKGLKVIAEKGIGDLSSYPDYMYTDAGAEMKDDAKAVFSEADVIMKFHPPTEGEVEMMKEGSTVISFMYPARNEDLIAKLNAKNITSFGMDCVPRISRAQVFDALSSMANIAGYKSVLEAANHFGGFFAGQMTAAGRVDPAKVLVIGAGVAGLAALQTAKNMGAIVRAFDTRAETKEQVESFGGQFLTVEMEEDGDGGGGYAKEMSDEFIEKEMELFAKQCEDVDIIITTALIPGRPAPLLIKREHIEALKPGSVVVDLAAPTGGNIETTKPGEIYEYHNVTHIGTLELPQDLPTTATTLYSNNIRKLFYSFGEKKHYNIDLEDEVTRGSIVTYEGETLWPAPVKPAPPPTETEVEQLEEVLAKEPMSEFTKQIIKAMFLTGALGLGELVGLIRDESLMNMVSIFSLGCIVGYKVVHGVLPALHSPLISVTNAVSGIIICGGMLLMPQAATNKWASMLGAAAVLISSVNVFGGFLITQKMLNMFRKDDDPNDYNYLFTLPAVTLAAGYLAMRAAGYPLASEGANLMASLACILALGGLCQHETSRLGNLMGMTGVGIGALATLGSLNAGAGLLTKMGMLSILGGGIGLTVANKVRLMDLPQLVALFHSFVGLAACLIGFGSYLVHPNADLLHDLSVSLGIYIGGVTFTGSVVAFLKLNGMVSGAPIALPMKNLVNGVLNGGSLALSGYFCTQPDMRTGVMTLGAITAMSFAAGAHMALAIGGADMPVSLLTIVGSLVGASGAILSAIMCKAMNRSILNVLFQGVKKSKKKDGDDIDRTHVETSVDQLAEWCVNANDIVIVPGFGLAAARGQYGIAALSERLIEAGKTVRYCIHPVAGRMPGQMNVLLAEAGVPHDVVFEMEELEEDMPEVDLVLCLGSNDIFNSDANDDPGCPIAGMPVIPVWEAQQSVVFKRTMGTGYSAIDNPVFYNENNAMMLGDAKDTAEGLAAAVAERL